MSTQDVHGFCKAISGLWLAETICDRSADLELDSQQVSDTRQQVRDVLAEIKAIDGNDDLLLRVRPEIERFESALGGEPLRRISQRCDHLRERLLDELSGESYKHLTREDARYLGQLEPFGADVGSKFPRARADLAEAADCLALSRSTACVFHLMRAMEAAVRRLATKLVMPITPQTTWRQLTGNMDAKIKTLPQGTTKERARKDAWEAARINLHHLGSVIRNNTMHPTSMYSQDEARHIFETVGVTMRALCAL